MKSKILLGLVSLMVVSGSLVGCNAMEKGMDENVPTDQPSATATAGDTADKPLETPSADLGMTGETTPQTPANNTQAAGN